MSSTVTFGMWNVRNFSQEHSESNSYEFNSSNGFTSLSVKHSMANVVVAQDPDVLGILEVTLATGQVACELLRDAVNDAASNANLDREYKIIISDRNVPKLSKHARKADKYSALIDSKTIDTGYKLAFGNNLKFRDRLPAIISLATVNNVKFQIILWHAPNPERMSRNGEEEILALVDVVEGLMTNKPNRPRLIAGDFNLISSSIHFDELISIGFKRVFKDTPTMILSSETVGRALLELFSQQMKGKQITVQDVADELLGNAYDNMFYENAHRSGKHRVNLPLSLSPFNNQNPTDVIQLNATSVPLTSFASTLARILSDHCPLFVTLDI